jgi:carbamoyltransferase
MGYTLGIHVGHDASCAIVSRGSVIAAVQQERISRRKHDGSEGLSNSLPVYACLQAAGIKLSDIDHIVSSFQMVAPGGFGLHRPLIDPDFELFDPWDSRHIVVSHHLAHAYCTFYSSGFDDAVVMICDLGGSSTLDGKDFHQPFGEWFGEMTRLDNASTVLTECFSIYEATRDRMVFRERDFCVPHSVPESFVQNVGSLYDNVARCIFGHEDAHGQLMALAAFDDPQEDDKNKLSASDIIEVTPQNNVIFRNDWQHKIRWGVTTRQQANLARACQTATEDALMAYARRARKASSNNIAVAGGVFLNILANTEIAASGLFEKYYVPSAPHDAGISIGCAFFGDARFSKRRHHSRIPVCDRLGRLYGQDSIRQELTRYSQVVSYSTPSTHEIAAMIADGAIIARWGGRAEFGPRALGGRSLIGSPLLPEIKDRMNNIKGRQSWRPVAPIVTEENVNEFFDGPTESLYMTFAHMIRADHRKALAALHHPDGSTRAQTLPKEHDPALHELLVEFRNLTGYPILVNTSMNGAGEPIIETPREALRFFLTYEDIDALLLESSLAVRRQPWESGELKKRKIRLADGCLITMIFPNGLKRSLISRGKVSFELSETSLEILTSLGQGRGVDEVLSQIAEMPAANDVSSELYNLIVREIVITAEE